MQCLQDQHTTNDAKVTKTDQQKHPERDIPRQYQHDVGTDNEHFICQWIEDCTEAGDIAKALGDPAIEAIGDTRGQKDRQRRGIPAVMQEKDQYRHGADTRQGQKIRKLMKQKYTRV